MKKNVVFIVACCMVAGSAFAQWNLNGNAGTNPGVGSGQNFLGTTDAKDLIFATGSFEVARVYASGGVSLGINNVPAWASVAAGNGNTVSGGKSFAAGWNNTVAAPNCIALGAACSVGSTCNYSHAYGTGVNIGGTASGAYILGGNSGTTLTNTISNSFMVGWGSTAAMLVTPSGLGLGTTNITAKLTVNGNVLIGDPSTVSLPSGYRLYVQTGILAEKVKVAIPGTANWSDYVFEKTYKLKSFEELESYILANKHLPNIPSAEEMVKEGLDVANMDAKLLEKIEELHLYFLQLEKRLKDLEAASN